ncbi:hypothetical protein AB1Y20_012710 [Prymnesium parvum]|uniref:U3 small nucleolar RNA-associated protein 25 n=1 Tax=Prymnesium parvum TaxID=97485 RepID=A0AB34IJL6_PRYPA
MADRYSRLLSLLEATATPAPKSSTASNDAGIGADQGEGGAKRTKRRRRHDSSVATTASEPTHRSESVRSPDVDAAPNGEAEEEDDAAAGGEAEEEDEQHADEAAGEAESDAAAWVSKPYEAHFNVEWTTDQLDEREKELQEARWKLPGLGDAVAMVPSGTAAPELPSAAEACLASCHVLPSLRERWSARHGAKLTPQQRSMVGLVSTYRDVLHCDASLHAYSELLPVLALHAVQHLVVSRRMLQRHAKREAPPQDQGFTRPTVLVVLPFRAQALAFMQALLSLLPTAYEQVENKARFFREFGEEEGAAQVPAAKPEDYKLLFAGNNDDCFKCGVRVTRKSLKLYSSFYQSDLVIASPLGLRVALGDGAKKRDVDWLSSIEVLLVPYADVLLMQNWAHFSELLDALNQLPTQQRDTDFSRVRSWFLDGAAPRLRQTVLLSAHPAAELHALLRTSRNVAGRVRTRASYAGLLAKVPPALRQLFVRFAADDPATAADARLDAFRDRLLPSLLSSFSAGPEGRTLLFVPSYFDFVRVRELLTAEGVPFVAISEYTPTKQVSRARSAMQNGTVPLLLYTERAHFFRRHKLSGARHLAVYSLPSYASFYVELLRMLERPQSEHGTGSTCAALFSRLDLLQLQQLVGDDRARRMLSSDETSFLFC